LKLEDEKLDVLILDRGLFDGLVWIDWQEKTHRVSKAKAGQFRSFVLTPRWRGLVDLVFVMHCDAKTSLKREHANQITLRHGAIMNVATLTQIRQHYLGAARRYAAYFKSVHVIENSRGPVMNTLTNIAKRLLNSLGRFADEEVLCLPRRSVEGQIKLSESGSETCQSTWNLRAEIDRGGVGRASAGGSSLHHTKWQPLSHQRAVRTRRVVTRSVWELGWKPCEKARFG
jgi:hypothetical protein